MRSPDRLFQVIDTLNFNVVGHGATALKIAAIQIRRGVIVSAEIMNEVAEVSLLHGSDHVRELAVELLTVLEAQP